MRITSSVRSIRIRSALLPSERSTIGPTRLSIAPRISTAPAPSAKTAAVARSAGSVRGIIRSAPITRTLAARPDSIWPQATETALRKPVQAELTS